MTLNERYVSYREVSFAERLWTLGEHSRALRVLEDSGADNERAVALRAKLLSRGGKASKALETIEQYCVAHGDSYLLCAIAATASAQVSSVEATLAWIARVGDVRKLPISIRGESAFYVAQAHWIARQYSLAEDVLPVAFGDCSANGSLRARILYGLLLGVRERYVEQASVLRFAVQRALGEAGVEVFLIANAVHSLFMLAWDTGAVPSTDALQAIYNHVKWPEEALASRFQSTRALGWRHLLEGRYLLAYALFDDAITHAPSPAYAVTAQIDRVHAARRAGEMIVAEHFLAVALAGAAKLDPRTVSGDEQHVFLDLCDVDHVGSPRWMAAYDLTADNRGRLDSGAHDRRFQAMEDYARGLAYRAVANDERAGQSLRAARDVFRAIGYRWRESLAEEALQNLATGKKPLTLLTAREREVFDLICESTPLSVIAGKLHIAAKTAENYKDRILAKLEVKSQRDLARVYHAERVAKWCTSGEKLRDHPSATFASLG
jgi:DNA-binding CsgD family transcriptional regulator